MEEWIRIMKRMMLVFIAGLLAVAAAVAMAEEADVEWTEETFAEEASAEETCLHEHTQTAYYFDAPEYFPLDGEYHLVVGMAIVEVTCQDCGEILSVTQESNAQETRSHVFRNGVCALCGYEAGLLSEESEAASGTAAAEKTYEEPADWTSAPEEGASAPAEEDVPAVPAVEEEVPVPAAEWTPAPVAEWTPAPAAESVFSLSAVEEDPDQFVCTLTGIDLENAAETLVLRPDGRDTAIVVKTDGLRREIDGTGTFIAQIVKTGDPFMSTYIRMYDAFGAETTPDGQDISLRIYAGNNGVPLTVTFTDATGFTTMEEACWDPEGYWVATWHGDGLYSIE